MMLLMMLLVVGERTCCTQRSKVLLLLVLLLQSVEATPGYRPPTAPRGDVIRIPFLRIPPKLQLASPCKSEARVRSWHEIIAWLFA
jgi:hypothetical protein